MAIIKDATAHPTGSPASASQDHATTGNSVSTLISTAGNDVFVAFLFSDGGNTVWPATIIDGTGMLWTKAIDAISSAFPNFSGVAIYTAFSAASKVLDSITATLANSAGPTTTHTTLLGVYCFQNTGTAFTSDLSVIGALVSVVNDATVQATELSITPQATGSVLIGIWSQTDDNAALIADSNASPFDLTLTSGTTDAAAVGTYKVSGTMATTTAGVAVTFGSTLTRQFVYMAAIEIKIPAPAVINPNPQRLPIGPKLRIGKSPAGRFRSPQAYVPKNTGFTFPVTPHASGRYLVDSKGTPFPILGDSAWMAINNLSVGDQEIMLNSRLDLGFTCVLVEPYEHKFTQKKPPLDVDGNLPFLTQLGGSAFTGSPNGTTDVGGTGNGVASNTGGGTFAADPYTTVGTQAPDFTTPNPTYWARVDNYFTQCAKRGLLMFVYPSYFGFNANDEGWNLEMVANSLVTGSGGFAGKPFADPSKSKLWNFAAWLGDRYKNYSNIVWILGGDSGLNGTSSAGTYNTNQSNAVLSIYQGINSISSALSKNWTGHWARETLGTDISADATNGAALAATQTLESSYPRTNSGLQARLGYSHSPALVSFDIENTYEGDWAGPERPVLWWQVLGGIGGYFWCAGVGTSGTPGSIGWWGFPGSGNWKNQLATIGTLDAQRLNIFWRSIRWWTLVPSALNSMITLVTSGGGTESPQSTDYVTAASDPAGNLLVLYIPPAHTGTITVAMSAMSATSRAYWVDPTSLGVTPDSNNLTNTGTKVFTPPGTNSAGATDWVLVIDTVPSSGTAFVGSLVEIGSASDLINTLISFIATLSETGSAIDSENASLAMNASLTETGSSSDSSNASLGMTSSLSETGSSSDTYSVLQGFLSTLSENGTASDTLNGALQLLAVLSELGTASDSYIAGSAFTASLVENGISSDTISVIQGFLANLTETGVVVDNYVTSMVLLAALSENGTAVDQLTNQLQFLASYSDSGTSSDIYTAGSLFLATLAETGSASDSLSAALAMVVNLSETGLASLNLSNQSSMIVSLAELMTGTFAISVGAGPIVKSGVPIVGITSEVPIIARGGPMAMVQNIEISSGEEFVQPIIALDDDGVTPFDMTGRTIVLSTSRYFPSLGRYLFQKSSVDGGILIDTPASLGTGGVNWKYLDTSVIPAGLYYWDLVSFLTSDGSGRRIHTTGYFKVKGHVNV